MLKSFVKVNSNLELVIQDIELPTNEIAQERRPVNYVFIGDNSGSMYGVIKQLREDLKHKIKNTIQNGDTITIAEFSGEGGDYSFVTTGFRKALDSDFAILNKKIDDKFTARNCTCFSEVFTELPSVIEKVQADYPGDFVLIFLTDGYPVVSSYKKEVENLFKALNVVKAKVLSSLLVGYGDYYNRELMVKMAEALEGTLIHSEDLAEFSLNTNLFMENFNSFQQIIEMKTEDELENGIVFSLNSENEIISHKYNEETKTIKYFHFGRTFDKIAYVRKSSNQGTEIKELDKEDVAFAYAMSVLLQKKMKFDVALETLAKTGDIALIDILNNAVTNTEYAKFETLTQEAIKDSTKRFLRGFNLNHLPDPNKFCVLELVNVLLDDDDAKFYPYHPDFKYRRISTGSESKDPTVKFEADKNQGFAMESISWNEKKLNLSVLLRITGSVTLKDTEKAKALKLPNPYPTFIWRNYTFVNDGVLNVKSLPLSISKETYDLLVSKEVLSSKNEWSENKIFSIDLTTLPIVNKAIISKEVSMESLSVELIKDLKLKAELKVFKDFKNSMKNSKDEAYDDLAKVYGEDGAEYLLAHYITPKGYAPESVKLEPTDKRLVREFEIKIKGFSSLPKVSEVIEKIDSNKALNGPGALMKPAIDEYRTFCNNNKDSLTGKVEDALLITWLEGKIKNRKVEQSVNRKSIQETKFALILGKKWFKEFDSKEDCVYEKDGYTFTISLREVEVAV